MSDNNSSGDRINDLEAQIAEIRATTAAQIAEIRATTAAQIAEIRARAAAQIAEDRARALALSNGTFFSTIDEVWNTVVADIQKPHLFGLDSQNRVSLIRTHHAVVADTNQYEQTVIAANQTAAAANEQTAIAAIGNRNEVSSVADSSTRSSSSNFGVNIFGKESHCAALAHLLPHASSCSKYWIPIVPWVLCTGNIQLSWDFMQKCIHGTLTEPNDGDDGSNALGRGKKHSHVGIKHFLTNRIRLDLDCPEIYLDKFPCVIIVPILTLEEVRDWNGEPYGAIVFAGDCYYTDQGKRKTVSAAETYRGIHASANMQNYDDFVNDLATEDECNDACLLLKQFIFFVCETFHADVNVNLMSDKRNELTNFNEWKRNFDDASVPVPLSNEWDVDKMKVRKVSFAVSTEKANPAPDPVLLLAKAASNWLRRHELAILPGWGDDNSTSRSDNDYISRSDDSTDSAISYSEEESIQGRSRTAKKPCIAEVNVNINKDEVEEPLSDDEFLFDK
jgi:hypothetical protein